MNTHPYVNSNTRHDEMVVTSVAPATPADGIVSRYLEHLRIRNLRPWTIYSRHRALVRLATWAGGPILYLTERDLLNWQAQRSRELQPEPLRTDMSHHRQFFRWATREGFLTVDPTARLDLPRVARRVPRPIEDAKLAQAIQTALPDVRASLALAAFAGLRACEIAGLDWSEVGVGPDATIRVTEGKGGHMRVVPMSAALARELDLLPHRRGPVIPRRDGNAGRNRAHRISTIANTHLRDRGLTETLHQCRHRFATTTYRACQDIRAVGEMLGHASPATTSIYAAASSAVARSAVEAAGRLAA